jgi:hypothetical protein
VRVGARLFLAIGAFVVVAAAVYWFTSYEDAGTAMLLAAGVVGLVLGGYLWATTRRLAAPDEVRLDEQVRAAAVDGAYLPHASVWPFALGIGSLFLANGLLLGGWALLPGAIIAVAGLWGCATQSRRRD